VIDIPDSLQFINGAHAPQVSLSRDGSRAVFFFENSAPGPLYTRRAGELQFDAIPGSDTAWGAVIAPSGREVLFWIGNGLLGTAGRLMRVPIEGGPAVKIADSATAAGQASWGDGDRVLFRRGNNLMVVSKDGGPVRLVAKPDTSRGQFELGWPDLLPGGHAALVTILHGRSRDADSLYIGVLSLDDGRVKDLGIRGLTPRYASGHLIYVRQDGQLFARPFDVQRGAPTAEERAIAKDVNLRSTTSSPIAFQRGVTDIAVSQTGAILFTDGGRQFTAGGGGKRSIVVEGKTQTRWLEVPQRLYEDLRASPDGSQLAVTIRDSSNARTDIWLLTFASGQLRPFTRNGQSSRPVWSPDGKRIVYRVTDPGARYVTHFVSAPWDESEPPKTMAGLDGAESVEFPEPGGKYIAIVRGDSLGGDVSSVNSDILIAPIDSPAAARPFAATGIRERMPRFSPDGKWLAYVGYELPSTSGGASVGNGKLLLRAVPGPGAVTQVSLEDGNTPLWSRDGHTLYYFAGNGGAPLLAARIVDSRGVESPARAEVFSRSGPATSFAASFAPWTTDILPNGEVIYLTSAPPPATSVAGSGRTAPQAPTAAAPKLIAIVNWRSVERAAGSPK
jgi:hypothetical protein